MHLMLNLMQHGLQLHCFYINGLLHTASVKVTALKIKSAVEK